MSHRRESFQQLFLASSSKRAFINFTPNNFLPLDLSGHKNEVQLTLTIGSTLQLQGLFSVTFLNFYVFSVCSHCRNFQLVSQRYHKLLWNELIVALCLMSTSRVLMRLAAFHAPFAAYLLKDFSSSSLVGRELFSSVNFHSRIHCFTHSFELLRWLIAPSSSLLRFYVVIRLIGSDFSEFDYFINL